MRTKRAGAIAHDNRRDQGPDGITCLPFDGTQFLLTRWTPARWEVENDQAQPVIDVVVRDTARWWVKVAFALLLIGAATPQLASARWLAVPIFLVLVRSGFGPRRAAAFYDVASGKQIMALVPERFSWRGEHRLSDADGQLLAVFRGEWLRARWTCFDPTGQRLCRAAVRPHLTSVVALGRTRWARTVALVPIGCDVLLGHLERHSPYFNGNGLLTVPDGAPFDRRIVVAAAVLLG